MPQPDRESRILGERKGLRPPGPPPVHVDSPTPVLLAPVVAPVQRVVPRDTPRLVRPQVHVALDRSVAPCHRIRGVGNRAGVSPPAPVPASQVERELPHDERLAVRLEPSLAADPRCQAPPPLGGRLPADGFVHGESRLLRRPGGGPRWAGRRVVDGVLLRRRHAHALCGCSLPDPAQHGPAGRVAVGRRRVEDGRHGGDGSDERRVGAGESPVRGKPGPLATVRLDLQPVPLRVVRVFGPV